MLPQFRIGWFSFSLRTLLALVTMLCLWLGWHVSAVRERRAVIQMIRSKGGLGVPPANLMFPGPYQTSFRRLLKDVPLQKEFVLANDNRFTVVEVSRIRRAFPEASVSFSKRKGSLWGEDENYAEPWPLKEDVLLSEQRWRATHLN